MKKIIPIILLFNSFGFSQITDSHGGDFVVVSGTTTYESLPFIETFSDQDGPDQEFNTWVSAQWSSYTSTTDDYDCLDTPCTGDDEYVSFLTPPDSFMLEPPNNNSVRVWEPFNSAPNWSANPVAYFKYSRTRNYSTSMYSPLINISDFSDLEISFDMHFDAWSGTTTNEYLYIEYCTGSGWENALTFMANATSGAVDIPWGNNSFFLTGLADLDTLQIRFRTAGTNAYSINYWYVDNVSVVSSNDPAQTTYVPDNNFEQALIDAGYDDVLDDSVLTATISTVGSLYLENKNISDLTGIEDFSNLSYLRVYGNGLTSIDVSNNPLLTYLNINNNDLTSLDVSNNPLLTSLQVSSNGLTTMDVSNNDSLIYLYLESNSLASITGLSNNTSLEYLRLKYNELTSLDLSGCTSLRDPQVFGNNLSSLDLTGCTEMVQLSAQSNELTTLDLSTNDSLVTLYLEGNDLTSIDVTDKPNLAYLRAHNNDLSVLDLTFNPDMNYIHTTGNDSLSCIYVADIEYAQENWTINIDSWTSLCQGVVVSYPGCTDPFAMNYDPEATLNDGSCEYPDNGEFSLSFDGVDDYAIDSSAENMDNYTVSMWIKSGDINQEQYSGAFNNYTSNSAGFQIDVGAAGANYRFHAQGHDANFGPSSTEWVYLAVTANGSNTTLYYDGDFVSQGNWSISSWDQIVFGRNRQENIYGNFKIDEASIWNTALTQDEIQQNMYSELVGSDSGLVAYYKFDAGTGDTLYDHSGNANHLMIYGATWTYKGPIWHVSTTGSDSTGDGSEGNPYASIQHAINNTIDGNSVIVGNGTYIENINFEGKGILVTSVNGPDSTIINGGGTDIVVTFDSYEDASSVLSGFTITNGNAQNDWPYNRGGGINCQSSGPTLTDLIITGNTGQGGGGGVYLKNSSPEIYHCDITNNTGGWNGGGLYIEGVNQEESAYLHHVDITGNTGSAGGGAQIQGSNPIFEFVEISGNTATAGGGLHFEQSHAELYNVTIVNNTAQTGGGIQLKENYDNVSVVWLENSIMWANNPQEIYFHPEGEPNYMSINQSDIEGGYEGIELNDNGELYSYDENIDVDPLFCDFDNGDFSLSENSPCLDIEYDGEYFMGVFGVGCGTLEIEFPSIVDIWDVPDDQGNWVYIQFTSSVHDASDEGPLGSYTIERLDDEEWVSLHSIDAYGADYYTTEAHTLMDSTEEDDGMTSYRIVAAMEVGALISAPAAGYSIDNIAPGVPTGLMATISEVGIHLSWDLSTAEDFQYFDLEKSSTADFGEYQVIETADTAYLDTDYEVDVTVYYRLVAYDDGGNASEHSVAIDITVLWADLGIAIPDEFAIHQNYPNPFNPVTTLRYDLPENGHVNITIYDMLGRQVKTLINEYQDPGYRSIIWDATNDYGKPVSAGMYLYQIHAGEYISTKKMVLLK